MFCTKCGSAVAEGTAFCTACGQSTGRPLSGAAPAPYQTAAGVANPFPQQPAPIVVAVPILPYAGFWLRFVAYLIDMVIIDIALFGIVILGVLALGGMAFLRGMQNGMDANDPAAH